MAAHIQLTVFVASSFFLVAYSIWLFLAWRFAARWTWLQAFHPAWRYGITGRNAVLYGLAAGVAWLIANSALALLSAAPASAQLPGLTLFVALATAAVVAWTIAYVVLSRRRDEGMRS